MSTTVITNQDVRKTVVHNTGGGLVLYARSASGPPGPPGPGGGSGAAYVHTQAAPSDTWTINHNLGVKPITEAFTVGGLLVVAEVLHTSINQTVVSFNSPMAGFARLI